ncbi:hypothetical protein ACKI1J_32365 [Streptomyces scabiei]|uniref:DUF2158 domain-containing protein n=1 Tax=Streptomyces brasiliscabiei TaxID=2736302 RepID=A0ABU8GPY1_9ACTN
MQQRKQVHTTVAGDLTITGDLYVGRKVGDLTIRDISECMSGRWVTFSDGSLRVFNYARRVNT